MKRTISSLDETEETPRALKRRLFSTSFGSNLWTPGHTPAHDAVLELSDKEEAMVEPIVDETDDDILDLTPYLELCLEDEEEVEPAKVSDIWRTVKPMNLPTDLITHIVGFMSDDQLFENRLVCKSFHKAYYNQRVVDGPCKIDPDSPWPTFLPSRKFNAVRALRLANRGKVFPKLTCLDLGGQGHCNPRLKWRQIKPAMFPKLRSLYIVGTGLTAGSVAKFPSLERLGMDYLSGSSNFIEPKRFPGLKLLMQCTDTQRMEMFRVDWSAHAK